MTIVGFLYWVYKPVQDGTVEVLHMDADHSVKIVREHEHGIVHIYGDRERDVFYA
jgi:acyl-homoserine lactone acylase PvdQ